MLVTPDAMPQVIVVTGDVTMDWNIASARQLNSAATGWTGEMIHTQLYWQRGGAALQADLIDLLARRLAQEQGTLTELRQMAAPHEPVAPNDARFHHAYKQWSHFPRSEGRGGDSRPVWRMAEWLGFALSQTDRPADQSHASWQAVVNDTAEAQLVVLDDAALGFRDRPALWPLAITAAQQPWILLKMSRPVAQGPLWEELHNHAADRLIVVTTIDDLRQTEVQISRGLSWERTAQDLVWELAYNPSINSLTRCAHVIVSLGAAGAIWVTRPPLLDQDGEPGRRQSRLFFDPTVVEGMWEARHPGMVSGSTSCLTAALAQQLILAPEQPDIGQAIQTGLAAVRTLHEQGNGTDDGAVTFPLRRIVDKLLEPSTTFAVAPIQDPGRTVNRTKLGLPQGTTTAMWTILEDQYTGGLETVAQKIVLQGVEVALQGVPLGHFGALLTIDRREIENFRGLGALVLEYCRQPNPKRPLSLAVFGTPGSGKSFGVTQVASSLLPGQIEKLEFNLSQFSTPHQLLDAFHRVRDTALAGRIPLVFWDEFDTALENQPLGWLRHFLAPMQDGAFQEGQIIHPLGRAIFVFAGGTSETMAAFDKGSGDPAYRAAKGPDFVSRLKGFVDIVGPNPKGGNPILDRYSILRRAILLRTLLQSNAPQIFQRQEGVSTPRIDSGVLRAFLEVPAYKHGARSMEALVATSLLAGKSRFERSALPTESQLSLHVDERQFLSLVQRIELIGEVLERLAAAAYDIYRTSVQGLAAPTTAELRPYRKLSEAEKEPNRALVRDIPNKLAYAGYVMRPARSDDGSFTFPGEDRETLAEQEHDRWLKAHVAAGWRYGEVTNGEQQTHAALLPWRDLSATERTQLYSPVELAAIGQTPLPESEKAKNRDLIDGIPHMLARAGYTLVKIGPHAHQ